MRQINYLIFLTLLSIPLVSWAATATKPEGTLMVKISAVNGVYFIEKAWVVTQVFPARNETRAASGDLMFRLTDQNGQELSVTRVRNPAVVRAPLRPAGDCTNKVNDCLDEHQNITQSTATTVLRFPYYSSVKFVELLNTNSKAMVTNSINSSDVKQRMELNL